MLLTLIECTGGEIPQASLEALALARGLGAEVECVAVRPTADVADTLAKHGVATLHALEHDALTDYSQEAWGESLRQIIEHLRPSGVLAAATERGNEIMAQVAARMGLPLAANCLSIEAGQDWQVTRIRGGGMLLEDAELSAPVALVTVQPGAADAGESDAADVTVARFEPELGEETLRARIIDRTMKTDAVTLASAKVVVSGGRGIGSAEGFAALEELAELVGGAVGCSRVATNNGWRSHSDQVGLTGTKIAADLYIACGISGATQHWVGCMDAKTILAINTDAEAPMVTRAAYAVIGDVHAVLPAVIEEVRKRRH